MGMQGKESDLHAQYAQWWMVLLGKDFLDLLSFFCLVCFSCFVICCSVVFCSFLFLVE